MSTSTSARRVDDRGVLGQIIRSERRRRGLTQVQLAAAAGVARGSLQHLEKGDVPVTVDTLLRVTGALALDLHLVPRQAARAFRLVE